MIYKAKARVKVVTEAGKWYLAEIKGLKEGTIVEGIYNLYSCFCLVAHLLLYVSKLYIFSSQCGQ